MSSPETQRHDLYNGLNELLGPEPADMEYLPTDTNLATRGGLLELERRLEARMDRLEGDIGEFRTELKDSIGELKAEFKELRTEFNQRLDRVSLALISGLVAITASFIASVFFG